MNHINTIWVIGILCYLGLYKSINIFSELSKLWHSWLCLLVLSVLFVCYYGYLCYFTLSFGLYSSFSSCLFLLSPFCVCMYMWACVKIVVSATLRYPFASIPLSLPASFSFLIFFLLLPTPVLSQPRLVLHHLVHLVCTCSSSSTSPPPSPRVRPLEYNWLWAWLASQGPRGVKVSVL